VSPAKDHGRAPPPEDGGSLSNSLLVQALAQLTEVATEVARNSAQNELLITGLRSADESRSKLHQRLNEIAENVAGQSVEIEKQSERLDVLDPIVTMLRDAHIERRVIRGIVGKLIAAGKKGYVLSGTGAIAGVGVAWHQWDAVRAFVLRLIGAKVGGP
jgi:hypothetical protein